MIVFFSLCLFLSSFATAKTCPDAFDPLVSKALHNPSSVTARTITEINKDLTGLKERLIGLKEDQHIVFLGEGDGFGIKEYYLVLKGKAKATAISYFTGRFYKLFLNIQSFYPLFLVLK